MRFCLSVLLVLTACTEPPPRPSEEPDAYARLVREAGTVSRAQEDSTFLWMRNTTHAPARRIMLDLKLDYVRYDRRKGVVCTWRGGGITPIRGYAYRLPGTTLPADSLGDACHRTGGCALTSRDGEWVGYRCD